ncbi:MAG TPA: hypothetical protein VFU15_17505, partial [Bacteroidia bacterium]|nr:hypothetical protein [Bacteroidia bacterium]
MKPQWKIIMLITALCITRILSAQQADRSAFRPASATNAGTTVKPDFRPAFLAYDYDDYDLAKHKRRKKHKGGGRGRDQAFGQGKFVITAGYGFPNLTKAVFKAYESNLGFKVSGFGPMHVKFDYGVTDKLSLGLSIRYLSYKVQWTDEESITTYDSLGNPNGTVSKDYTSGYKGSALGIMAHMNLHFATGAKIDPYWGIGIG